MTEAEERELRAATALARDLAAGGALPFAARLVGPDGVVLSEAGNTVVTTGDATSHAEINLIRQASPAFPRALLATSTLYASAEPCAMCAGAIAWSPIGRVVYGLSAERVRALDPGVDREPGVPGRTILRAARNGPAVLGPALEDEAATLFPVREADPAAQAAKAIEGTILWRRLDQPGHESAQLARAGAGWQLAGSAVFRQDGESCRLDYQVTCDRAWRTVATLVRGWVGPRPVHLALAADAARRWWRNGEQWPSVAGCLEVDLSFSPATNLLPIRRLGLAVGERADVRAAWVRVPQWSVELLPQVYARTDERTYTYESNAGRFRAELEVDGVGFVTRYPGFWEQQR